MAAVYSAEECSLLQTDIEISYSEKHEDMAQKPCTGSGNSDKVLQLENAAVQLDLRAGGPALEAQQHEEEAAVNAAVPQIKIKEEETEENEYITVSLNVAGEDSDEQTDGNASLLAVDDSTDVKLCSMRCQDCGQQFTSWEACKSHLFKHLEEEVKLERERKKRPVVSTVSEDSGPRLEKKMRMDIKEEEISGPGLEADFKEEEIFDPRLEMDFKEEEISDLRLETKVRMNSKEDETSGPRLEKTTRMDSNEEEMSGSRLEKKTKMHSKEEETSGPRLEKTTRMDSKEDETRGPQLEKKTRMDSKEEETSGPRLEKETRMDGKEDETSGPQLEKKTRMDSKEEEIKVNSVDHEPLSESSCQIKPYEIFIVRPRAAQSEEGNPMSSLAKRVYVCSICGKMYSFPESFRNHQKTHVNQKKNGEFSCKECGKSFARSAGLAVHMRYHRQANLDELPSLRCEQCNKDFHTTHTFTAHQKMHKQKPFWCHKCRKGFKSRETLDKHLLGHDVGKYRCLVCQKAFQVVSELCQHFDIHRAPKPHRCDVCQRNFSHLGNLIIHRKKHLEMSEDGKKKERRVTKKRVVGGSNVTVESDEDSTSSSESSDSSASTGTSDSSNSSSESSAGEQEEEPTVIEEVEGELEDGEVQEPKDSGSCMPFSYPLSCVSGGGSSRSLADESDDESVLADKSVSSDCSSSSSTLSVGSPLCCPAGESDEESDASMLAEESDSSGSSSDSSAGVHEEEPAAIEEGEESDDSESTASIGMSNSSYSSSDSSAGELEEGEIKDIRELESGVQWACFECGACFFNEPELHIHYMKHANGMS